MKWKITTFSLKGKENIWWEYRKNVRCIYEEELTWSYFERLFQKKYLLERYYDARVKDFYELQMGSMKYDGYTSRFLELLRYVPYLNGLPTTYGDQIEFDKPKSWEEAIRKLKHCYIEQ